MCLAGSRETLNFFDPTLSSKIHLSYIFRVIRIILALLWNSWQGINQVVIKNDLHTKHSQNLHSDEVYERFRQKSWALHHWRKLRIAPVFWEHSSLIMPFWESHKAFTVDQLLVIYLKIDWNQFRQSVVITFCLIYWYLLLPQYSKPWFFDSWIPYTVL